MDILEPQDKEITIWIGRNTYLKVDGLEYKLSAEDPANLSPLLRVMRNTVQTALAHENGKLELISKTVSSCGCCRFQKLNLGGITGRNSLRVVCMPGGDLAIWQTDPDDISKE